MFHNLFLTILHVWPLIALIFLSAFFSSASEGNTSIRKFNSVSDRRKPIRVSLKSMLRTVKCFVF